ncbi:MAG: tripartite tricarboxylate transporter substrate binding protein [Proteobacteria bacterium]|nr:tripartite tricarboxylate transporter substrate binding protein [Pseudomonadota bacterium]
MRLRPAGCVLLVMAATMQPALAWPERPVRVVIPFAPGGGTDATIRIIADAMKGTLGQPLVLDNRPGASTIIGTEIVAKSKPDGYTVLLVTSTFAINPTVKELVALAKARPGDLTYASVGTGSSTHLATELLVSRSGMKLVHVPYKGSSAALTDLLGGHVSMYLGSMPASLPQARSGKLRALAVTGASRASAAPELPTIAESGVPGYEFTAWYGLFMPAGTPAAIVGRMQSAVRGVVERDDIRRQYAAEGNDGIGSTPEQFAAVVREDIARYAKIVRDAGIRPD